MGVNYWRDGATPVTAETEPLDIISGGTILTGVGPPDTMSTPRNGRCCSAPVRYCPGDPLMSPQGRRIQATGARGGYDRGDGLVEAHGRDWHKRCPARATDAAASYGEPQMDTTSINAYDLRDRVRRYDADMDVMHPLRWKMIDVALEVLPFNASQPLKILDLGIGTGAFTERLLAAYTQAQVVGLDGAAAMLELARARLAGFADAIEWIVADFQAIPAAVTAPDTYDAVVSSYALHHLSARQKRAALKPVIGAIKPAGWFLNADVVVAEGYETEARIQQIRVEAVTARAAPEDQRFHNADATRQYLCDLEAAEQDQPQTLEEDLRILRDAGLASPEVFWKEYREAVIGGPKVHAE